MDEESEDSVWQHTLKEPNPCAVPELSGVARSLGITCQRIFERAYARRLKRSSFARAMFARYLDVPPNARQLPQTLKSFCEAQRNLASRHANGHSNGSAIQHHKISVKRGFCIGCMLNRQGSAGIAEAYEMIHPDVFSGLEDPPAVQNENLPEVERLWLDLLDSGTVDHPSDSWQEE